VVSVDIAAGPSGLDLSSYVALRRPTLVRAAVLLGCEPSLAEDLVQATLVKVTRHWKRISRANEPDAYVYRMLVNAFRDSRARRHVGEVPAETLPEADVADVDLAAGLAVRRALATLSREHREVLVLRFFADLTEGDTATGLDVPLGTVKSRTARALQALAADPRPAEEAVMLTESEARDLLALAGATIEVSPVTTLPDVPSRRRWPVLAAAAGVLAVVGVGGALGLRSGGDASLDPELVPRVDFQARSDAVTDGQLPSVFGYGSAAALEMLTDLGLEVRLGWQPVPCGEPVGRAARTEPRLGAPFEPGDSVVLFVTGVEGHDCPTNTDKALAWRLIDFANGRGPAPDFADQVTVAANGESATIPAAVAESPAAWVDGTPLGVLRQQSREVLLSTGYSFQTPILATRSTAGSPHCHGLAPAGGPGSGVSISIEFLSEDPGTECTVVDVFRADDLITAISLRTGFRTSDSTMTPPDAL